MTKSANEVMQQLLFAAVMDAVEALKKASKGVPNNMLRDLNALHVNAAYGDTPAELQQAIEASVRTSLQRLQREGYAITPLGMAPPPPRPAGPRPGGRPPLNNRPRTPGDDRPRGPRPGGDDRPRGPRPGAPRPPRPPRPPRDK